MKMRVVAGILYIVVVAICGLGIQGGTLQDYPSVSFQGSTLQQDFPTIFINILAGETYGDFIAELREIVTRTADTKINGIPVLLNPAHPVPVRERFVMVHLTGRNGKTVILALDVTNLYVAAFSANNVAYYFSDFTDLERENLFSGMLSTITLSFSSKYVSLEHKAGVGRENISLGPTPLDEATKSLWSGTRSVTEARIAEALLVVIQMVSEAARFRHIEERVRRSFTADHQLTFRPDGLMVSMENEWSSMSLEVQRHIEGGIFIGVVQLQDESFQPLRVDNFNRLNRYTMVALLLFRCHRRSTGSSPPAAAQIIRMLPVVLAGREHDNYDEETCRVGEPTRRISGRDGLCVDVRDGRDSDGNPIQLWPCGGVEKRSQQWTFHTDGTIRSMGKCMTAYGYSQGDYVMIFNCSTAPVPDATKWVVSIDGSITNSQSRLLLTALQAAQGTTLLVAKNRRSTEQAWSVGDDVEPIVTYIVGFKNILCMQRNSTRVWLEDCAVDRQQQRWALYSDATIRVDSDRSLCMHADLFSSTDIIIIHKCVGGSAQRWIFNTYGTFYSGTIYNRQAQLVMDVALREIILNPPTGNPNQQWMTMTRTRSSLTSS